MRKKLIFTTLSALAATVAPIATASQCGGTKQVSVAQAQHSQGQTGIGGRIDFNNISADGIAWNKGVAYESSAQGLSFLFNIAQDMGWQPVADKLDFGTSLEGYTSRADATPLEKALMATKTMHIDDPQYGIAGWASGIWPQTFLDDPNGAASVAWGGDGNFATIEPASDANKNLGTSHFSVVLPDTFKTAASNEDKAKIFANALIGDHHLIPYTTTEGFTSDSTKLLFQIDETTNTLHIWLAKSSAAEAQATATDTAIIKGIFDNFPILATPKVPLQDIFLDPAGSDGSMGEGALAENAARIGFGVNAWMPKDKQLKSLLGLYTSDGNYSKLGRIGHYRTMIDGNKPGSTILKMWVKGTDKKNYIKTLHSNANVIRTYPRATVDQERDLVNGIILAIANIKEVIGDRPMGLMESQVNEEFVSLIKYLVKSNWTKGQIKNEVTKFNNGSHHIEAILGFLQGWKNLPDKEVPGAGGPSSFDGLISVEDAMSLLPWFKWTPDDNHSYIKGTPTVRPEDDIYVDPTKTN